MTKALPKWTEERTEQLSTFVGTEVPVSQSTVAEAAEQFETTTRSISSKLRKMGFEVELASANLRKAFSDEQADELADFVEANSGRYTYGEIAEQFADGEFTAKQIQGKILSLELTDHVRPTPKPEVVKTYSDAEEATFIRMEREVNSIRGKALSLLRSGAIDSIPPQRDRVAEQVDPLEALGDITGMSVEDIAEQLGKTVRGVKTMLTRRGLVASNYDGASRKEKAAG